MSGLKEAIATEFGDKMASKVRIVSSPKATTNKEQAPVKTVEDILAGMDLEAMIRMAIEKEMATTVAANQEKIAHYESLISDLEDKVATWERQIATMKEQIIHASGDIRNAKNAMKSLKGDQEVVDQRVAMALAVARGEKASSIKPAKKFSGSSEIRSTAWEITIDGNERSFKDLTKLTYWLGQRGQKISAAEFRTMFANANDGMGLLGQNHKDAGIRFVTVNGFRIGITAK